MNKKEKKKGSKRTETERQRERRKTKGTSDVSDKSTEWAHARCDGCSDECGSESSGGGNITVTIQSPRRSCPSSIVVRMSF